MCHGCGQPGADGSRSPERCSLWPALLWRSEAFLGTSRPSSGEKPGSVGDNRRNAADNFWISRKALDVSGQEAQSGSCRVIEERPRSCGQPSGRSVWTGKPRDRPATGRKVSAFPGTPMPTRTGGRPTSGGGTSCLGVAPRSTGGSAAPATRGLAASGDQRARIARRWPVLGLPRRLDPRVPRRLRASSPRPPICGRCLRRAAGYAATSAPTTRRLPWGTWRVPGNRAKSTPGPRRRPSARRRRCRVDASCRAQGRGAGNAVPGGAAPAEVLAQERYPPRAGASSWPELRSPTPAGCSQRRESIVVEACGPHHHCSVRVLVSWLRRWRFRVDHYR